MNNVAIVGVGTMGSQIAAHCALKGHRVWAVDADAAAVSRAINAVYDILDHLIQDPDTLAKVKNRIVFTNSLTVGVGVVELVIESVPENLDFKCEIFRELDRLAPDRAILATNSSSIMVSQLESGLSEGRLPFLVNLHFYPEILKRSMVEIMAGSRPSAQLCERCCEFVSGLGLTPILVKRESAGFVFNRIWQKIKAEALSILEEGVATYQDIDRAWMIGSGMPIGLFGLMDMVGLDVVLAIYRQVGQTPPSALLARVERGDLGMKTGRGFYTYPDPEFQHPDFRIKS